MKFLAILFLLLLSGCAPRNGTSPDGSTSHDPGTSKDQLVLMALNAEFLWDGVAPEEGEIDFAWKGSKAKAEQHMAAIAGIVSAHDPDLLHLAEVENLRALTTFNERFLGDHGYHAYLVNGTDTATGQDVALLSRFELEGIARDARKGRSGDKKKSVSKNYVATLRVGDLRLGLVGVHLLAGPTRRNRIASREAQADAVRGMARDLARQGHSLVVWGDFNDFDGLTLDRSSNKPVTRVLKWIRALDPADPSDDLVNVSERLPQGERYTNGRDAIDHVLVSPDLASRVVRVAIPRGDDPTGATNHDPIVVHLRLGPSSRDRNTP